MKTVIIYNPRAGKLRGRGRERLARAADILRRAGHEIAMSPTTGPRMADAIARRAIAEGAGLIVVAGGDGTINEAAEGMVGSQVPLAILPAGTANVLATETSLGRDMETAASNLAACEPHRVSVGRITTAEKATRHFLLMAGVGLDAQIVYRVSLPLKARAGKLAYWVAGFSLVGRSLPEFQACVDGHAYACSFALVSKVRNYGGDFEIARDTSLFDDRFEVVLFEGRNSVRYLKYFTAMVFNRLKGVSGVHVLRARGVQLHCPGDSRIYMQIDGEFAGHLPGSVELVPDALTLMVPKRYAEARRGRGA